MSARPLDVAAIGTLATALVAGLVVPPDAVQGDLQRIMYVHVPSAWLAYLSFTVTLVASVAYLRVRSLRWDRLAGASAEDDASRENKQSRFGEGSHGDCT